MSDSMDLFLYENLRKRIINNENLSEKEWDLFFYIEEKTKGIRIKNNEWSKIFLNSTYSQESQLKTSQKQELEVLKEEYILNNADEITENTANILSPKHTDTNITFFNNAFFRNRQLLFAVSTGFVILFTTVFLFSNRNKVYTGDLVKNEASGISSSIEQSDKFNVKENSEEQVTQQNDISSNEISSSNSQTSNIYSVNDFLEDLNYRDTENSIKLTEPLPSAEFANQNPENIIFKGELISKSSEITSIILKIFDNSKKNYIDDNPLLKKEISWENNTNDNYLFDVKADFNLRPGLFYYTFEDMEGNLLFVGKFSIKG